MKLMKNLARGIKQLGEKLTSAKGRRSTEKQIFNHPRRDSQVRSGKK